MSYVRGQAAKQLRDIVEASEVLKNESALSPLGREAAYNAIFKVSQQGNIAQKFFSSPGSSEPAGQDWQALAGAAAMELRSAQVLTGVALVKGEISIPDGNAQEFLESAIAEAKAELASDKSDVTEKRFASVAPVSSSVDLTSGISDFRKLGSRTIEHILQESEKVISSAIDAVKKQGGNLLELMAHLDLPEALDKIEGFVAKAWEKIKSGFGFLRQIAKSLPSDLSTKLKKIQEEIRNRANLRNALKWLYSVEQIESEISNFSVREGASLSEINMANRDMAALGKRFTSLSSALKSVCTASTVIGLVAIHFAGPGGALCIPVGNGLAAAALLFAGMNFMGTISADGFKGVRQIELSLARVIG